MAAAGRAGANVSQSLGEPSPLHRGSQMAKQATSVPLGAPAKRERYFGIGRAVRSVRRRDARYGQPLHIYSRWSSWSAPASKHPILACTRGCTQPARTVVGQLPLTAIVLGFEAHPMRTARMCAMRAAG